MSSTKISITNPSSILRFVIRSFALMFNEIERDKVTNSDEKNL